MNFLKHLVRQEVKVHGCDIDYLFLSIELAPGARHPALGWPVKGHHNNFGRRTHGMLCSSESASGSSQSEN